VLLEEREQIISDMKLGLWDFDTDEEDDQPLDPKSVMSYAEKEKRHLELIKRKK
jgi:hypothetical protein